MKRIIPKIFLTVWIALLILLGGYYLFFAPRGSEYSAEENRTLAGFPEVTWESVFSGKFGEEFEKYLLDHFPWRNAMITATNKIQSMLSFATHDEYLLIADGVDDPLVDDDFQDDLEDLLGELNKPTEPPTKGSTFKGPFHLPRALAIVDGMMGEILGE